MDSHLRRPLRNRSPAGRRSEKGHLPGLLTSLDSRFRGNDGWVGAGAGRVQTLTPVSGTGQAPALSHDGRGGLTYNGEGIPLDTQLGLISGKATSLRTSS